MSSGQGVSEVWQSGNGENIGCYYGSHFYFYLGTRTSTMEYEREAISKVSVSKVRNWVNQLGLNITMHMVRHSVYTVPAKFGVTWF